MNSPDGVNYRKENADLRAKVSRLEQEIKRTQDETAKYFQNVAHQLIAPLHAIIWGIEGASADSLVPAANRLRYLRTVQGQAKRLVHLVNNFRLLSDLEANNTFAEVSEAPEIMNLKSLAREGLEDHQQMAVEKRKTIEIEYEAFEENRSRRTIEGIRFLVTISLANLLSNAVKYADVGTTVKISYQNDEERRLVGIGVTSLGLQIREVELARLVERGERGEEAARSVPAGSGMGLYLVERIMDIHKGELLIQVRGRISEFMLMFPYVQPTA